MNDSRGATVMARDFMVMQVPSHELEDGEKEVVGGHLKETADVTESWVKQRWADLKIPGIEEYQA